MKFIRGVVLIWSAMIAGFLILEVALYGVGLLLPAIEPDFGFALFFFAFALWVLAISAIAMSLMVVHLFYWGIRKIIGR